MSIQGSVNSAIGTAGIFSALAQQSPGYKQKQEQKQVTGEVSKLMAQSKKLMAESEGKKGLKRLDLGQVTHGKMEQLEKSYPLVQFPEGYLEAKQSLAKKMKSNEMGKDNVKQKRQSYLDQPTSIGGTLRDLNLSSEQKRSVRTQLKGGK